MEKETTTNSRLQPWLDRRADQLALKQYTNLIKYEDSDDESAAACRHHAWYVTLSQMPKLGKRHTCTTQRSVYI